MNSISPTKHTKGLQRLGYLLSRFVLFAALEARYPHRLGGFAELG
jgi:hypothetical protein